MNGVTRKDKTSNNYDRESLSVVLLQWLTNKKNR